MSKQPPSNIDPIELMAFLACYEEYPTSGFKLARAAEEQDRSAKLTHFLEHIPGEVESEQSVVSFAEEAGLDIQVAEDDEQEDIGELDIETVKETGGD